MIGLFENVSVLSSKLKIKVPSGSVDQLHVETGAKENKIELSKEAKVLQLTLDAVAELLGEGSIEKAAISKAASGSSFETKPKAVTGEGAGQPATLPPVAGGGGGGGGIPGGGNGGGTPGGENPGGENPGGENPGGENPGGENPGGENPGGENPGGENPGGENPGGENGECEDEDLECENPQLLKLEVEGFTLNQIDFNYFTIGTGFNPNVLRYKLISEHDISEEVMVTANLSMLAKSKVIVSTYYSGESVPRNTVIIGTEGEFQFKLEPKKDARITIALLTKDKSQLKQYEILYIYKRSVQEGMKLGRMFDDLDDDGNHIITYQILTGFIEGELIKNDTDAIRLYKDASELYPFYSCEPSNIRWCTISEKRLNFPDNTFYVKIFRGDTLIAEGEYRYEFSPVALVEQDIGITVSPLTKQELIDEFEERNYPPEIPNFSSGYRVYLDRAKLAEVMPEVKFMTFSSNGIYGKTNQFPLTFNKEELKEGIFPTYYLNYYIYQVDDDKNSIYASMKIQFDKLINDEFLFIALYDKDLNVIGQYRTVIVYDADHVADGYEPARTWEGQSSINLVDQYGSNGSGNGQDIVIGGNEPIIIK